MATPPLSGEPFRSYSIRRAPPILRGRRISDARVDALPLLMLARRGRPSAGEGIGQQLQGRDFANAEQAPTMRCIAGPCELVGEQPVDAFLRTVVMRLGHPLLTVKDEANEPLLAYRREQQIMPWRLILAAQAVDELG